MLLVSDSGSTKADWNLAKEGKILTSFSTIGLNPFFHTSQSVIENLKDVAEVKEYASQVSQVQFFGAGCSHLTRNEIIAHGLQAVFANAKIKVRHDLDGAALATCNDKPGIACILGTGSNSCYFDGVEVHEFDHGLGYIIGDEGSGSYYGRKLLAYYLYKVMPEDLRQLFYKTYHVTKESIMQHVYMQPNVNVYLASHSPFLSMNAAHPFVIDLVSRGMGEFMDVNVCNIENYKHVPVHFIGSIAFYFRDILHKQAKQRSITVGNIIAKPIDGLTDYFLNKEKSV